jgi:hypothetical protein
LTFLERQVMKPYLSENRQPVSTSCPLVFVSRTLAAARLRRMVERIHSGELPDLRLLRCLPDFRVGESRLVCECVDSSAVCHNVSARIALSSVRFVPWFFEWPEHCLAPLLSRFPSQSPTYAFGRYV